jgi:hypothetical protein
MGAHAASPFDKGGLRGISLLNCSARIHRRDDQIDEMNQKDIMDA